MSKPGKTVPKVVSSHYVLAVQDLDVTADWYTRVLGAEREEVDEGNWAFLHVSGVTFICGRCPGAAPARDFGDYSYFAYIVIEDIDAFTRHAKEQRAEILQDVADRPWGMREVAIRTFDGHRMMFASRINAKR